MSSSTSGYILLMKVETLRLLILIVTELRKNFFSLNIDINFSALCVEKKRYCSIYPPKKIKSLDNPRG